MRKLIAAAALLALLLAACAGEAAPKEYDPAATAKALLDAAAFSETLEPLDADLIAGIYGLDADPADAAVYASTGATAEEIVVLRMSDKTAADGAFAALEGRVADQKVACRDYLPLEGPKLDNAVLKQAGSTVLLVVASDYEAVQQALEGLDT